MARSQGQVSGRRLVDSEKAWSLVAPARSELVPVVGPVGWTASRARRSGWAMVTCPVQKRDRGFYCRSRIVGEPRGYFYAKPRISPARHRGS